MIGNVTSAHTRYTRAIAMDIVNAKSYLQGEPQVLLEARVKSSGSCGQIAEVFDEMLVAMFEQFPGENGRSKRVIVNADVNC